MASLKDELTKRLKENRPQLSDKSIKTYISTLSNLPKKLNATDKTINIKWYDDNALNILNFLQEEVANKRKSVLSALYILTKNEDIHDTMIEDAKFVNDKYKQQRMSETEKENWIDWKEVLAKHNALKSVANSIFKKKMLTEDDFFELNKFMLLSCFVYLPPRRVMDYALMKTRNFTKEDNYISKGNITFNQYKTAKQFGSQTFPIPKEFNDYIKKWIKINTTDYLIISTTYKPVTSSQTTKLLNAIFGKNISSDMLRHSYLTNYYSGTMPPLTEMEELGRKMGHSIATQLTYIKRDILS